MRTVEEDLTQERLVVSASVKYLLSQRGQHVLVEEGGGGISAVEPAVERRESVFKAGRRSAGVALADREFGRVEYRLEAVFVDAFFYDIADDSVYRFFDEGYFVLVCVFDVYDGLGLQHSVGYVEADVVGQAGVKHRAAQRRLVRVVDEVGEKRRGEVLLLLRIVGKYVSLRPEDFSRGVFILADGVATDGFGGTHRLLEGDVGVDVDPVEAGEIGIDQFKDRLVVKDSVEEYPRVRRRIEAAVALEVALIGQLGDVVGVAARAFAVAVVGEEKGVQQLAEPAVGRGVGALHLAVYDAVAGDLFGIVALADLPVPALLQEGERVLYAQRIEDGVEIDPGQVEKVAAVAAAHRVDGLVGVGHRVEEGVHRGLYELDEGLLDRILFRSAEDRVLKDVEDAGVVVGDRLEGYPEGLVAVVVGALKPDEPGAVFFIGHPPHTRGDLGYVGVGIDSESVEEFACLHCDTSFRLCFRRLTPGPDSPCRVSKNNNSNIIIKKRKKINKNNRMELYCRQTAGLHRTVYGRDTYEDVPVPKSLILFPEPLDNTSVNRYNYIE